MYCIRFAVIAAFFFAALSGAGSASLPRSISTSRQFIIFGTDVSLRGAVSDVAEQTKANLLRVLDQRDEWKTPIVINLGFPQANLPDVPASALYFSQTGSGLKLQLDLTVTANPDVAALQREILRALLLELIYRKRPDLAPGTAYVSPPEWLLDGILAVAPGEPRAPLVDALAPVIASNQIVPLPDFLRLNPAQLDSPARLVYRACSMALVQLLLEGGPTQLKRYIGSLSLSSNDPLADLKSHFPILATEKADAVWKMSLRRLDRYEKHQLLTFAEGQRQLEQMLSINMTQSDGSAKTYLLDELLKEKKSAARTIALRDLGQRLTLLSASTNPVLRPIVLEYQRIVQRSAKVRRSISLKSLSRVEETRAKLNRRMTDIDDYMNWFEATQAKAKSGAFSDYLKAAGESNEPRPRRRDPLSVYLDALEGQVQN